MKLSCILPEESTDLVFIGWHTHARTHARTHTFTKEM